jgi:HK97 family phage portal protein
MGTAAQQLSAFRSWTFAAVRLTATRVAGQPLRVGVVKAGRVRGSKQAAPAEPLDQHPILTLLDDPNPTQTGWSLIYSMVASLELTGQCLLWLPMEGERRQAYYIPSSWIEETVGGAKYEGWKIRPPNYAGEPIPISADDAVYCIYPNPADPRLPYSPLMAAAAAVDCDSNIITSQASQFRRGWHPSHAIIIGEEGESKRVPRLTDAQQQQLLRPLLQRYSGTYNHGHPIILDALVKDIKALSTSIKEMDYLTSGRDVKERILQAFGVSPILLGQVEGANRASATVADEIYTGNKINPLLRLLSETLTAWLSPMFSNKGEKLAVWFEPAIVRNEEYELRKWQLLVQAGSADINEMRQAFGFKNIDIGGRMIKAVDKLLHGPVSCCK